MAASSRPAFDEIPYLDDYLREIVRPRAERTLQSVSKALSESVWQHLIRLLAAEQPAATDATPAMLRSLLENQLGLRINVSLQAEFGQPTAGQPPSASDAAALKPEVVVRRGAAMPLVNAVLNAGTGRT